MTDFVRISDLMKNNTIYLFNGGIQLTNNNAYGVKNSVISFGKNATNTVINNNNNGVSEDLLLSLLKEIEASELKNDEKEELKELVEAAQAESEGENPKNSVIRSMLNASKGIMDTVTNSPALIDAYTKWVSFLQNPPTL